AGRHGEEGRHRHSPRGDENGAADPRARGRHGDGGSLCRGRDRAAGRPSHRVHMTPPRVTIVEVGPRDGLQNEQVSVSTADKIEFVNRLSAAGLPVIEVSAFVRPKWVPQMADAGEVFAGITRTTGTRYTALVPNLAGHGRALA